MRGAVRRDFSHAREIAEAGGRMPFNARAILDMLDEIDDLRALIAALSAALIAALSAALEADA